VYIRSHPATANTTTRAVSRTETAQSYTIANTHADRTYLEFVGEADV
jgi:hypothetical protein